MKINRENINKFYAEVNDKIDEFFSKNISARAINRYFFGSKKRYGLDKFIKREGWEDVEGIEKVIRDVVEDRLEEKLMTFENYQEKMKNMVNFPDLVDTKVEKIIADLYRVSLGHIESNNNHLIITGLGESKEVYLFGKDEMKKLILIVCNQIYNKIISKKFTFSLYDINLELSNKIDKEKFITNTYSDLVKNKLHIVEVLITLETGEDYKFKKKEDGIYIFEKS